MVHKAFWQGGSLYAHCGCTSQGGTGNRWSIAYLTRSVRVNIDDMASVNLLTSAMSLYRNCSLCRSLSWQ